MAVILQHKPKIDTFFSYIVSFHIYDKKTVKRNLRLHEVTIKEFLQ